MSYEAYKILHLLGLFLTFTSLGGLLTFAAAGEGPNRLRGPLGAMHGVGLLIAFIAGFGMHAKLHLAGFPGWFIAKIVLWVVVAAWIMIPRRAASIAAPALWALPLLGLLGAVLAILKPF